MYTFAVGLILLLWFELLEKFIVRPAHIMHVRFDDYIPFVKYFALPYVFWFFYVGMAMVYFFFKSRTDFLKLSAFLYIGMSICYTIYMIYPNGQDLRPTLAGADVFERIICHIYANDTPTNCFPSIHTLNSIAVHAAICEYEKSGRAIKAASFVTACLICISTVTIKQHSCVDLLAGAVLAMILYMCIYKADWYAVSEKLRKKKKAKKKVL